MGVFVLFVFWSFFVTSSSKSKMNGKGLKVPEFGCGCNLRINEGPIDRRLPSVRARVILLVIQYLIVHYLLLLLTLLMLLRLLLLRLLLLRLLLLLLLPVHYSFCLLLILLLLLTPLTFHFYFL